MNEIGNRQNRIRVYNNNKRRNKKKSLIKYKFLFLFVPIIGLFQYLFSRNKDLEKEKMTKLNKLSFEIDNLNNEIKEEKTKEEITKIENNILEKEIILNKIKDSKENIRIKSKVNENLDKLDNYKIDIDSIKQKKGYNEDIKEPNKDNKHNSIEIKNNDLILKQNIEKEEIEKQELSNKIDINKEEHNQLTKEENKEENEEIKVTKITEHPFKNKMLKINLQISEIKKDFVNLELRIKRNAKQEEMNKDLEEIRKQIDELKEELKHIKDTQDMIKLKNDFEILKMDTNKFLEEKIFEEFEMLYSHQYELINKKKEIETEKVKELEKEKIKKEKQFNVKEKYKEDLFLMEDYIKKDIAKMKKEINKLNKMVDKQERKLSSVPIFRKFLTGTLRFGVSLLPMALFKNKLLGSLLSMVMLNNKIRGIRNVVRKQKITYLINTDELLENIKKNSDITNKTLMICDDSLYQLYNLREEILGEYQMFISDEEISQTLNKIEVLENTLIKQKEKITGIKQDLNKTKQKILELK